MQPLQCVLQHHVAYPHVSTHMATEHDNNYAAIPMQSASRASRNELRTQEQPLVAEHRGGTKSRMKRPQPHPPHTRGTFHRRLQPLCTEKQKVVSSGFLPKTKPMQHSCSHYNMFCSITWLTRMYLRTWQHQMITIMQPFQCDLQPEFQVKRIKLRKQEQLLVAEHRGGTNSCMKRPRPHPPHKRGTFHRRLQPLCTEKHKGVSSGFLPKTKPMQHSCSHYNAFCSITWLTRMYLRTWQQSMTTIMQPFQCDLQPELQETQKTTQTGTTTRCRTQRRNQFVHETTPAAPAAHTRYLSLPAAATLHGKTQGFVLRLPPQNKAHATFMQPLQCVLQHHVAYPHVSTHMATEHDNNHAAIPMRSATRASKNT